MEKNAAILSIVGVAAIVLVLGVALGSVIFPTTTTETIRTGYVSTQTVTQTVVQVSTLHDDQETITKQVIVQYVGSYNVYVFGNCTTGGGTLAAFPTTTTSYILPNDTNGYLDVTIVTQETTIQGVSSISTFTIYTSLQPMIIAIQNGTSTSYLTETCPTYP